MGVNREFPAYPQTVLRHGSGLRIKVCRNHAVRQNHEPSLKSLTHKNMHKHHTTTQTPHKTQTRPRGHRTTTFTALRDNEKTRATALTRHRHLQSP